MKKISLLLFTYLLYFTANAQVQQGGIPYSSLHFLADNTEKTINFPAIDFQKLADEDFYYDQYKDIPYRFGFNFDVNYNTENSGEWTNLPNGDRVWRISFYSENAQTLNFLLQNYQLAEGSYLFFYNEDKSVVLGSFNHLNNVVHKNLSTMPIPGSKITLEFYEPSYAKNKSTFNITRVTHGYRSLKINTKDVGDSGNCNNNVICAVGDNWRDQIRSVGIIIVGGSGICTGSLINNTCEDKKPYFLTANHCTSGDDVTTWNIGFNWQSANCNTNSGYQNISLQSVNVLALRANRSGSDFALLELTQTPPASYNVYYAGWDRSGSLPTSQVGIHHPAGDLKKISFDNNAATQATYSSAQCWRISNWEDGTTEGGSSGSPLFDQNKRIIGQLYGGQASCTNNVNDYYGRFEVSWNSGTSAANQLISWLDPLGLNPQILDGLDGSSLISDDVIVEFINKPELINCGSNITQQILLTNNGSNTATEVSFNYGLADNVQTYNWTGSLATGQSTLISFDKLILCTGNYDYTLNITSYNGTIDLMECNNDDSFSFEVVNGSKLDVEVKTNFQGAESSFEIYNVNDELLYSENTFENNAVANFSYCLPYGTYYFKMKDSGANGLTPTFFIDNGYYKLFLDGVELRDNDTFGAEENTTFNALGNGLIADFDNSPKIAGVNFTILSNSTGTPTSYLWEAPDANPSTGNGIQFNTTFANVGNFPMKLTITTDSACAVIEQNILVTNTKVAISEIDNFFSVSIYPNPVENILNITTEKYLNTEIIFKNILGQTLIKEYLNQKESTLNLNSLSKGIYYVELHNGENNFVQKVLIK